MTIVLGTRCVLGTGLGARETTMDEAHEAPSLRSCGVIEER